MLITTNQWFYAPNGQTYRAVYGTVRGVHNDETTLGIRTNRNSANWYVEIGNTIVAGCQIHYAVSTDTCNLGDTSAWKSPEGTQTEATVYAHPCSIYNADGGEG